MIDALRAEWTKLRTTRGPGWLLVAVVVLTVGLGALVASGVSCPAAGCVVDTTEVSLTGVTIGQAVVAVLGVLVISSEYSTAMIATTLIATPRRTTVLAAKAILVAATVGAAGAVAVLASVVTGRLVLSGSYVGADGYPLPVLTDGPTARAAFGSVLYLALVGLLSLGIATAIRDAAVAIGTVLGLLYLFPILGHLVSDPIWQRHLEQIGPMSAGRSIQATTDLDLLALTPWSGLGVLALWAAGSLVVGGVLLVRRDA